LDLADGNSSPAALVTSSSAKSGTDATLDYDDWDDLLDTLAANQ
jgi:hypothetical protein